MSFFESASLVFISDFAAASASAVSGSGTTTGKAYSIKPVPEYGSELITNGGFDTDSDWNKNTGWTISNGTANCDGTQTGNSSIVQQNGVLGVSLSIENGKTYKVTLTTSNIVAGAITYIEVGGAYSNDDISTNGTHSVYVTATSTNNRITIAGNISFIGSVDNVSVREVITPLADFTFERGSDITATRVNSSGLIEKGRGNFLLQSNQFDTTWTEAANSSVTSGQTGYDGTNDAWLLESTATSTSMRLQQNVSNSSILTYSVYAKSGTTDWLILRNNTSATAVWFDLANGVIGLENTDVIDSSIESVGDGWYRLSVVFNSCTSVRFYVADGDNSFSVTLGANVYIQDAQLEQGLVATDYIETTTTPLRAGILEDEPRFDYHNSASATPNTSPSLLLEPSRTNILEFSEYFEDSFYIKDSGVTATSNQVISPEGINNGSLISVQSNGRLYANHTSGTYISSVFIKAGTFSHFKIMSQNVDLTTSPISVGSLDFKDYGNGWYRIYGSYTGNRGFQIQAYPNNTYSSHTDSGDYYIYGAQLEEGSYPTSYIPTYGTAAERSTDSFEKTGLSSVIGQTEGTIFFEFEYSHQEINVPFFRVFENASNLYEIIALSSFKLRSRARIGGSIVAAIDTANVVAEGTHKAAITYKSGDYRFYLDGSLVGSSTETSIVSNPSKINYFDNNNNLKQFLLFPTSLSDTDCEILTGATTYSSFAAMASALNYTVYE